MSSGKMGSGRVKQRRLVIASRQVKVKIVGIGEGIVKAGEEVRLKLKFNK